MKSTADESPNEKVRDLAFLHVWCQNILPCRIICMFNANIYLQAQNTSGAVGKVSLILDTIIFFAASVNLPTHTIIFHTTKGYGKLG